MNAVSSMAHSTTSLPLLDTAAARNWETPQFSNMFSDDPTDPPMMSAGLVPPDVTWSTYAPTFDYTNPDKHYAPSNFSQGTSFFDHHSALASGEVSEAEDLGQLTKEDIDFDFVGRFSRTNTGSTGLSYHPSQENLTLDSCMGSATAVEFAKLFNKELDSFQTSAAVAPFLPADSEESSTFLESLWPVTQTTREAEAGMNDPNFWS
ncbi:hypothetical protein N0V82_006902 [Gnomoniopsis sp. IMI 355080]|nr:hypothetical protein N0V82_006902 [Gnomoniopsis sp. IMI 355080]